MITKEEGWVKASFDIKMAYGENLIHIEQGRIYKFFGVDMSKKSRKLYHVPTKTYFGSYDKTLKEIKYLIDRLLEVNIDWASKDNLYFQNIDDELKKQINKITMRYK